MNALLLGVVVLISNFIPMGMPQTVPPSKCVMQGLFPIDDGTCQNYYMCIFDGAKFAPYGLKCAGTTLFDPSLKYCTSDYFCTQIIHDSSSTSISWPKVYPLPDTKCQKYYFCFTNGVTTTRYNLTCPNSLLFNPDKQKCVLPTAYSCPPVV
ncbi:hypothetical protein WH47_02534 [Habropoda laboriosa]|uniref:Chitin-binding type-2 domain-containing protein n=1 Tax=Habropoda laboriosa TaxID=597456 RepID=A0A0L7QW74_9HYME|nr:hypothetical protein WH47_02534 [Habropoda laboriosa]